MNPFVLRGLRDRKKTLCITHSGALQGRVEGFYEGPMEGDQVPRKHKASKMRYLGQDHGPFICYSSKKNPSERQPLPPVDYYHSVSDE